MAVTYMGETKHTYKIFSRSTQIEKTYII